MKIQVFGSGCPACKKLYEITRQAAAEMGISEEVEYVTDVREIIKMGLMQSPVLAVNNKPVLVGFVPKTEEIKKAIQKGLE